jgi:hypothetical protein
VAGGWRRRGGGGGLGVAWRRLKLWRPGVAWRYIDEIGIQCRINNETGVAREATNNIGDSAWLCQRRLAARNGKRGGK